LLIIISNNLYISRQREESYDRDQDGFSLP
jgi:hypothetical protein